MANLSKLLRINIYTLREIYDGDDNDGLINIGPYEFTVQFYTGEVTGDFSNVSYYIKDKGYGR